MIQLLKKHKKCDYICIPKQEKIQINKGEGIEGKGRGGEGRGGLN